MPLFLFLHDLDERFVQHEVERAVRTSSRTELRPGIGGVLEWQATPRVTCELSDDSDAIWASEDDREAFEYLVNLASEIGKDIDMSDHDYSFHIHVHEHVDIASCWQAAEEQRHPGIT